MTLLAVPHSELNTAGLVLGGIAGVLRAGYVLLNKKIGELCESLAFHQLLAIGLITAANIAAVRAHRRVTA